MVGVFGGIRASPARKASNSIRLFVVCASCPYCSPWITSSRTYTAPQPPGPGLGLAAPSVNTPDLGPSLNRRNTSATGRSSSRVIDPELALFFFAWRPEGELLGAFPAGFLQRRHFFGLQPG